MQKSDSDNAMPVDDEARDRQLQDAMEHFLHQLETGIRPDRTSFTAEHPEIREELEQQLEALEFLHLATSQFSVQEEEPLSVDTVGQRSTLGDFQLIRPIGRGGMGVVYEAIQISLDRRVAVKVLPFAALLDEKQRKRFQNEARAAATLEHPNIVPIHFVGQERGVHFYSMQLIEGQSLAEAIRSLKDSCDRRLEAGIRHGTQPFRANSDTHGGMEDRSPVPLSSSLQTDKRAAFCRTVAELGVQAASALQYAHDHGIVHRDIKPGNLLLDENSKLWVTDFGLAHNDKSDSITVEGDVLGTLAYMSPEQRSGTRLIDARSDVFSLAATLYELLTLNQPFDHASGQAPGRGKGMPPHALRQTDTHLPVDLETILLKAMSEEPQDRYQTAGDFAEDLRRFAAGQTIRARRPSTLERCMKWALRHPSLAATFSLSSLALCVVLLASTWVVWEAKVQTQTALGLAEERAERVEELLYLADLQRAYQVWNGNRPELSQELLHRHLPEHSSADRRGYAWHLLNSLSKPPPTTLVGSHDGSVNQIAVFPDGLRVASVGDDKKLRIWEIDSGRLLSEMAVGASSVEPVFSVAVSPDGHTVATGSDVVLLWDVESGQLKRELTSFDYNVQSIAYSPNGRMIAVGSRYDCVRVFTSEGDLIKEIEDTSRHESLEFTPDSKRLIVPSRKTTPDWTGKDGFIREWDVATFNNPVNYMEGNDEWINNYTLAICAPDGSYYATCGNAAHNPIDIIEPVSGRSLLKLTQSRARVNSLAISPNSEALASAYNDGTIGYWRLTSKEPGHLEQSSRQQIIESHQGKVNDIEFASNTRLLTCSTDGKIVSHALYSSFDLRSSDRGFRDLLILDISPDGNALACSNHRMPFRMLSPLGENIFELSGDTEGDRVAFNRDSRFVGLAFQGQNTVQIREVTTGVLVDELSIDLEATDLCFSPCGERVAVIDEVGDLTIFNITNHSKEGTLPLDGPKDGQEYRCAYSNDGSYLLGATDTTGLHLIAADSLEQIQNVPTPSTILSTCIDHSGRVLATGHDDGIIRLWSLPTLAIAAELKGHQGPVRAVAFTPGDCLISTSADSTTRIWSIRQETEIGILDRADGGGLCVVVGERGEFVSIGYAGALHTLKAPYFPDERHEPDR